MKVGTVCFFLDNDNVLLTLIEYSSTERLWNGIGGGVDEGETPEQAFLREIKEETYLTVESNSLKKVAELQLKEDFKLTVFTVDKWKGEIKAKDPSLKEFKWFNKDKLPFDQMHEGNDMWLPSLLNN